MKKSFREHLEYLEKVGKLVRVRKEVDPKFEIAAGIRKASDIDGPALLFEKLKGFPNWRFAGGLFATQSLLAHALGVEDDPVVLRNFYHDNQDKVIKPRLVSTGPCKQVIVKEADVDLYKLPIPTYCERDCAPYLTGGMEATKDPATGIHNHSIIRRKLIDNKKLSLFTSFLRDTGTMVVDAENKGVGLGVATAIGVPPALMLASQLKLPLGDDEADHAGGFQGEPLEMVKCETIDVEVPASSEVVIEGVVIPGERIDDGAFGEYPGNYVSMNDWYSLGPKHTRPAWVTKTTAITMRKDPIFHGMLTGMPTTENHIIKKFAIMAAVWEKLLHAVPRPQDLRDVYFTSGAAHGFHIIVSINKRVESTPRDIIYSLLLMAGATVGWVTVVDDDINIKDHNDVEWAIATRCRPDRDIIILPPATYGEGYANPFGHMYRWGQDATKPAGTLRPLYDRSVPPGVDKVDYI